jgi:hypothetical protein
MNEEPSWDHAEQYYETQLASFTRPRQLRTRGTRCRRGLARLADDPFQRSDEPEALGAVVDTHAKTECSGAAMNPRH